MRYTAALGVALLVAACGSEGTADNADTQSLSRDLLAQPAGDGRSTPLAVDESLVDAGPRVPVGQVGINRGMVDAPVKVVELSDYGCSYCRQFHRETFPTILSDFIETGMVEWKFVPFVTGMFDNSLAVTEAVECTYAQSEAAFGSLNERMWDEQSAWKPSDDPLAVVRAWVAELDIDLEAYDACLVGDERLSRVASSTTLARQLGVRGTPTFIVLGYPPLQGALPADVFTEILTAVHEQAVSGEGAGAPNGG